MIRLNNVSKFYYNKGIITSGFTKVNLELNVGEFVVITGESGSGKSTLLNVISGLDTYEEGEMYIDGEETSHYTERDFEEYRNKYIGNIFQNFNLVNSYTVYENVELVLLINGYSKQEAKPKVEEIIEKVHLTEFSKTKVSKLSGGQKQRVAIARALAKETDVIVADEPTGNLDSVSAEGVIALLAELAKDKLIVVVTHNFEQFEKYATRRIKMNDGTISEDEIIKHVNVQNVSNRATGKSISFANMVKLGRKNAFNILPKFLLLLVVFVFLIFSVVSEYGSLKKSENDLFTNGYNTYFQDTSEERIVFNKADKSPLTEVDFDMVSKIENVDKVEKNDVALDYTLWIGGESYSYEGFIKDVESLKLPVDYGRMPQNSDEVLLEVNGRAYGMESEKEKEEALGKIFEIHDYYSSGEAMAKYKVSGLVINEKMPLWKTNIYAKDEIVDFIQMKAIAQNSKVEAKTDAQTLSINNSEMNWVPNDKVPVGQVYATETLNNYYKNMAALNKGIIVEVSNLYGESSKNLKVGKIITKKNLEKTLGYTDYEMYSNAIFINPQDMMDLTVASDYQYSVFANDIANVDEIVTQLESMGYAPLAVKDAVKVYMMEEVVFKILKVPAIMFLIITVFFISYFVIKLILRSRSHYFVILRVLGMNDKKAKRILDIELLIDANIAFAMLMGVFVSIKAGVINIAYLTSVVNVLQPLELIGLYVVIMAMVYLISSKFAKSIFNKSAMTAFREEV